jgi:hypothetical protein
MNKRYLFLLITAIAIMIHSTTVFSQVVQLGNGTAISVFSPLNRTNDYSVYEVIYLQSQINLAGTITTLGFQRHDGSHDDPIENVSIYLRHTNQSQVLAGNFDTTGYTLVYSGSFPNDSGAGWREVILDSTFTYNNFDNLQVLAVKGYQPAIAVSVGFMPRWLYTNINPAAARARRYYGAVPITSATSLTTTPFTSNTQLTFGTSGLVEINPGMVSVYPNPTQGQITFNFNSSGDAYRLQLVNSIGIIIEETELSSPMIHKTENLTPGVYFYSVYGKNKKMITSGKVVVIE